MIFPKISVLQFCFICGLAFLYSHETSSYLWYMVSVGIIYAWFAVGTVLGYMIVEAATKEDK